MINVVIPMAGYGSRFTQEGYTLPKPLVNVFGKPMIQKVVENVKTGDMRFIFIVQRLHVEKYCLDYILNLVSPNCVIIPIDGVTDGAARTVLLSKDLINNNEPMMIVNSDQFLEWNPSELISQLEHYDAAISVFNDDNPKWSFVKLDDQSCVCQVAEKQVISDIATCGIYLFKRGSDFVSSAEDMISKNVRFNNEFYVSPVFNEMISKGKKISVKFVEKMWGLGTPQDLRDFLENYHSNNENRSSQF